MNPALFLIAFYPCKFLLHVGLLTGTHMPTDISFVPRLIGTFVLKCATLQQITRAKVGSTLDSQVSEARVGKMWVETATWVHRNISSWKFPSTSINHFSVLRCFSVVSLRSRRLVWNKPEPNCCITSLTSVETFTDLRRVLTKINSKLQRQNIMR